MQKPGGLAPNGRPIDALVYPLGEDFGKVDATAAVLLIKKILFTFRTGDDKRVIRFEYDR